VRKKVTGMMKNKDKDKILDSVTIDLVTGQGSSWAFVMDGDKKELGSVVEEPNCTYTYY